MTDKKPNLSFKVKIETVKKLNPLFTKVKIRILYAGLNRNNSYISKDVIDKYLIPSLFNIPIVAEFNEATEDFGDHGGELKRVNGKVQWISTTKPYGLIPESTTIDWETVKEDDGTSHDYLTATGLLWTARYPELNVILEGNSNQSMELDEDTLQGHWQKDADGNEFYQVDEAYFSALCVLGADVEPCFENANVTPLYSLSREDFKREFNYMLQEINYSLNKVEKGGNEQVSKIIKFTISHEDIRSQLFDLLNPYDAENDMWSYNCSILGVYDNYCEIYDYTDSQYYRQAYTVNDDVAELGDKIHLNAKLLTDEELAVLNALNTNFEALKINNDIVKTELEGLKETTVAKTEYEAVIADKNVLTGEISTANEKITAMSDYEELKNFKLAIDTKEKEELISQFTILGEENLRDCKENIAKYSKDEIEAKLAVIAVRNKVSFSLNDGQADKTVFTAIPKEDGAENKPAYLKAVDSYKQTKNN